MNKESFLALLKDSAQAGSEVDALVDLTREHPYSQPLRAMVAKGSKISDKNNYQSRVTMAAVYSADRMVLKEFIEKGPKTTVTGKKARHIPTKKAPETAAKAKAIHSKPIAKVATPVVEKSKQPAPAQTIPKPPNVPVDDIAQLREEVLYNLQELIKNKQALSDIIDATPKKVVAKSVVKKSEKKPVAKKVVAKPKRTRKQKNSKAKSVSTAQKKNQVQPKIVKEELISKFIEASPSITPNKKFSGTQEDLSLKSVEFNEDLVSENLAEIFARQGKVKKAIEIYRKLIWKFPQKKAFFATRIEEIKTK